MEVGSRRVVAALLGGLRSMLIAGRPSVVGFSFISPRSCSVPIRSSRRNDYSRKEAEIVAPPDEGWTVAAGGCIRRRGYAILMANLSLPRGEGNVYHEGKTEGLVQKGGVCLSEVPTILRARAMD